MLQGADITGRGPLSRLDPRLSVIALVAWSAAVALVWSRWAALAGLAGSLVLFLLSGCERPGRFFARLLLINAFLLFVWVALPFSFSSPGAPVASLGPLVVTREGLDLTITLSIKALAITCGAMAVTASSSVFELTLGARALGAPEKLTAMMTLMTRYIQVVGEEFDRLVWAMRIRGFSPKADLHTLRSYANLAGVLLVRGLDRGERVRAAMLCRGWRGRLTLEREYRLGRLDLLVSLLILAMVALVVAIDALS
jgi:cobalt/nickel transport system permease protein